jgi:hypothetical protein
MTCSNLNRRNTRSASWQETAGTVYANGMNKVKHPRPSRRVRRDAALTVPVTLRLAEDEAEMVREAAALAGVPVAQWLRGTAVSASAQMLPGYTGGAAMHQPQQTTIKADALT